MLVHIVYVPDADLRGPDIDRINRVEEVPDEVGRVMLNEGSARTPTDDELTTYQESLKANELPAEVPDDGSGPMSAKRTPAPRSKSTSEMSEAQPATAP